MAADDSRAYIEFFGFSTDDWTVTFGSFANHHYILESDYISDGCVTTDSTEASNIHKFIFPHHIKKTYYIEGVIEGHITLAASGCTSTVTSYRVTICKMHEDTTETELASTGWITVNDTIGWDAALGVGEEIVYPFWIDLWEEKQLTENERIYLKSEVSCNSCTHLMHSNDSTWEDVWVNIPFRL